MKAIFKHEIRGMFHSMTGYLLCGAMLLLVGIGAVYYNITNAVSNFEYVLEFVSLGLTVLIPVLTMRSFAEERRQKTDQLLYALPLKTSQVVLGKFLALVVTFLVPVAVMGVYPLLFARYGQVHLPGAYGALAAFFFLGAALIAIGIFFSTLTDNQGFAAGIPVAIFVFNYYSVSLAEQISATAFGAFVAGVVIAAACGVAVKVLTRSTAIGGGVGGGLAAVVLGVYLVKPEALDRLLPTVMESLSLFKRFSGFVDGVFDLGALVFYWSVTGFFLFLSVQSLEKRRYN